MHHLVEDLGLCLIEKKKLRLWLKDNKCKKEDVVIKFVAGDAIAYCGCSTKQKQCKTNLSLGLLKERR